MRKVLLQRCNYVSGVYLRFVLHGARLVLLDINCIGANYRSNWMVNTRPSHPALFRLPNILHVQS